MAAPRLSPPPRRSGMPWFALLVILAAFPGPALAEPKMLFLGDSITQGGGATDPAAGGFVALIAERFTEFEVVNAGCGGSTVRDWTIDGPTPACTIFGAWTVLAEPELPAAITHILLGTNDTLGFFEFFPDGSMGNFVAPEEYEIRLRALVDRAPGLVLLSTPPRNLGALSGPVDDRLRAYRDAVLAIADESRRVALGVDVYALLDPASDFADAHPNDRGHARIADELERRILALLPRGALSRCRNPVACSRFEFLPRYRRAQRADRLPRPQAPAVAP